MATFQVDSASLKNVTATGSFTGSFIGSGAGLTGVTAGPSFIDNYLTVGLPGSDTDYNSISASINSITDASANNTYTVYVAPGVYIENPMVVPSYVAIRGDSSISTIVSASSINNTIFTLSDQSMILDMQIQGSTGTSASAVVYSSATTPQTNAISYVENVRFGSNYTNAKVVGVAGGNCIMQCSNVKYGGFTANNKSFDVGFHVTGSGGGIGRMQLRNVTSTNGGVTGSSDQIFALADAAGCTFIVNGCLLTRAVGTAAGTGFKVYNGGQLRLTGVNFQRWAKGIWAPQTGSAPSVDAIALNFENCTLDVAIEHSGSTGKVQGTDTFLKTQINLSSSLYEVGQDPRRITVGTKGADFTSISASVAYITDSSVNNRYVIEVGPGQFTEKMIDLTGKPYVSIVGSSIQTTQIFPSSSTQHLIKMGINNEVSFLSLTNAPAGYSALYIDDVGDYAQAHKLSFYDCDTCVTVISRTQDTKFYGEYLDFNGVYRTGSFISSSNGFVALASLENYYQFPAGATGLIANYGTGATTELDLYSGAMIGENDATSVAIRLENGADLQAAGFDFPRWGTAVYIPNLINSASFNIVGSMIHDSVNYDFEILHPSSSCRFQGTADHTKIYAPNGASNFFWTFLDETDGELDITRNLAVTFADGTHTDASTLIFRGSPMGVMEGGVITTSSANPSALEVDITEGFGYLETPTTGIYKRVDFGGNSGYTNITDDANNYLYVDKDGQVQSDTVEPSNITSIILGRVYAANGSIQFVDQSPRNASHTTNLLSTFNRTALGPVYAQGSIVTANGTYKLDVSSGNYYFGENSFSPAGGIQVTFDRYYRNTGASDNWNRQSGTDVPIDVWDSGSNALVALSASYYTKHTLYAVGDGAEEKYFLVTGQQQFSSLVSAEAADLPTSPNFFTDGVVQLAAVYVQSGSGITQIEDIRPVIGFRAGGVNAASDHGNLLGLADDDHTQYLLVSGTRAMSGPLTASLVSASSGFVGNLTGTASFVSGNIFTSTNPALSASYALTASYALASPGGGGNIAVSAGTTSTNLSSVVFANANNVSFGLNGSTITANAPIVLSAGTLSSNVSSLVFSNANGVSFGLNGNTLTATANGSGIKAEAGASTNTVSHLVFSNANNVSFGLNGSTITATAGGGGGGVTLNYFNPRDGYLQVTNQLGQASLHFQPAQLPNVQFDRVAIPINYTNTNNSSNSITISMYWGIYSRNASSLSLIQSVSTSFNVSNSGTIGSYSLYGGVRLLTLGLTNTYLEDQYYVGIMSRSTTSGGLGMTAANMAVSQLNSNFSGIVGIGSTLSAQYTRGLGYYSAATTALPSVVPFTDIRGTNSQALRPPLFYLVNGTF